MTGLAGAKIGMYATASTAAGSAVTRASFDWFQLTAPAAPSDEFDGDGPEHVPLERDRAP